MANPADPLPVTSYSDPVYDRLEGLSQKIRQRMALFIAALVAAVVIAVVMHQWLQNTPMAASAAAFIRAGEHRQDPAKAATVAEEYRKLVEDPAILPLFRTRACIELTQMALSAGKLDEARTHIAKAAEQAAGQENLDLSLAVQLSRAAVELQAGELAKAEETYAKVERSAGAKFPDRQLAAVLGVALALEKQGKLDDAAAKLETVINRADTMARNLLDLGRAQYWRIKRAQADKAATPAVVPAPTAPVAPAVSAPAK